MQVEITVRIDGQEVVRQVETVGGTLEQMEEKVLEVTRQLAQQTLQASVDRVAVPRPLFRQRAASTGTGDTSRAP